MGYIEYKYIKKFKPEYNSQYKDSKPNMWSRKYLERHNSESDGKKKNND